ncbi:hypothetical protein F511_23433 [Dorcoceras hygrometricum]|uniref:Uncharacterized protein n=1 Tax=Dorcoceras hygrometricum TaxID=472368 RepID=A0A2Z7DF08_9LAMI|nr:hypothetical protein F511_23433 [Dorcoceras hygrometricum]
MQYLNHAMHEKGLPRIIGTTAQLTITRYSGIQAQRLSWPPHQNNVGPFRHDDSTGRSQCSTGIQLSKGSGSIYLTTTRAQQPTQVYSISSSTATQQQLLQVRICQTCTRAGPARDYPASFQAEFYKLYIQFPLAATETQHSKQLSLLSTYSYHLTTIPLVNTHQLTLLSLTTLHNSKMVLTYHIPAHTSIPILRFTTHLGKEKSDQLTSKLILVDFGASNR